MQISENTIEEVRFDESDQNLFYVDDLRLKADALKYSILPKLHMVMNHCIDRIRNIYGIEVMEHCSITQSPNFRTMRKEELKRDYDSASVSLSGKRAKNKWVAATRMGGKPVHILPLHYHMYLHKGGLGLGLGIDGIKGLDRDFYRKIFDFHLAHESLIASLCDYIGMKPTFVFYGEEGPVTERESRFNGMIEDQDYGFDHFSESYEYPLSVAGMSIIVDKYVYFYPIFDSYIQIALGEPTRLKALTEKLNQVILANNNDEVDGAEGNENTGTDDVEQSLSSQLDEISIKAREAAALKVRVMPALRWQVFQRDGWKCVSCGRTAHDNIILHIDHIIPRSKGGSDTLENYQTLCNLCNLGKSNKDNTNLRGA